METMFHSPAGTVPAVRHAGSVETMGKSWPLLFLKSRRGQRGFGAYEKEPVSVFTCFFVQNQRSRRAEIVAVVFVLKFERRARLHSTHPPP